MPIYRTTSEDFFGLLFQRIFDSKENDFYVIVYDHSGRRLHTTEKSDHEDFPIMQAMRWANECDI